MPTVITVQLQQAHPGVAAVGERQRTYLVGAPPRAGGVGVTTRAARALHQQDDEHHQCHDRIGGGRCVGVEPHTRLEQSERDRRSGDGRQSFEAGDHQRSERLQQRRQPCRVPEWNADDPTAQEQGDVRHCCGDGPHHGVQPANRDAEHRRAITALGAGSNGHAVAVAGQEPGNAGHHQQRATKAMRWLALRMTCPTVSFHPTGRRNALARQVAAPPPRDQDADDDQQLGDSERRHGDHQARRVAEAADEGELDNNAGHDRHDQTSAEPEEVRPTPEEDERRGECGRRRPELRLGEVDDSIGPIDQGHADGHHGVQPAEHQPVQPQTEWKTEEDELRADDRGDGGERDDAGRVDVLDTGPSHDATVAVRRGRRRRLHSCR